MTGVQTCALPIFKVKSAPKAGKVGVVTGGGSGHEPAFLGYVGEDMVDAVAIGEIFSSPTAQAFYEAFKACDVILGPTAPGTAFKLGEKSDDPVEMYLNDLYTIPANLAGLPGMSLPCGFDGKGLPIGLQLVGNYFSEAKMLNVAHQYQRVTDWHRLHPSL